jgi:hypothetical protein
MQNVSVDVLNRRSVRNQKNGTHAIGHVCLRAHGLCADGPCGGWYSINMIVEMLQNRAIRV